MPLNLGLGLSAIYMIHKLELFGGLLIVLGKGELFHLSQMALGLILVRQMDFVSVSQLSSVLSTV